MKIHSSPVKPAETKAGTLLAGRTRSELSLYALARSEDGHWHRLLANEAGLTMSGGDFGFRTVGKRNPHHRS